MKKAVGTGDPKTYRESADITEGVARIHEHAGEKKGAVLAWLCAATSYKQAGDYSDSLRSYERALSLKPKDRKIKGYIEEVKTKINETKKTAEYFEKVAVEKNYLLCRLITKAPEEGDKKEYRKAADMEEGIARILEHAGDKDAAINWVSAGSCYKLAKDNLKALEAFGRALNLIPNDEEIRGWITELLAKTRK